MNDNPQRKYKVRAYVGGSTLYGPCDICGGFCDPIHSQVSYRQYFRASTGTKHWIGASAMVFGHLNCLEKLRREPFEIEAK